MARRRRLVIVSTLLGALLAWRERMLRENGRRNGSAR